ncbi:TonB-dependent receptor [Piscinibacter sp.]|jgi:hypothetical protein|uniref:TonB-dependent receptor n=1 Tax=Piscinibacter sp. TaxID=1903157 RepID=UPI002F420B2B
MFTHRMAAAGLGLAALVATPLHAVAAPASAADELQQLKNQIAEMRQAYEARLQALERRIGDLQQGAQPTAAAPAVAPPVASATPAAPPSSESPRGAAALASSFNPAISLILNGTYANLSRDPADYRLQGFIPSGGEVGPGTRGFSLGESELTLSANVDPTFSGRLTFALAGEDGVGVEEAFFERRGLFNGATLKAGRFLSSIGYLNIQHAHAWDFVDAPLAYQAFFGGPLKTDGVQLRWLAPTDRFVELGAEIGSGASFPGSDTGRNGVGSTAVFAHVGDDIGDSASWRVGASYLRHRAADRAYDDSNAAGTPVSNAFTGRSGTWVLDGIYKWAPGGNSTQRNLKIQGEYFRRTENGTLNYDTASQAGGPFSGDYRSRQSGWYLQAAYQFMPMWRVGARYDRLDSGTPRLGLVGTNGLTGADLPVLQSHRPSRSTVMVDYSLSEFSRFRLQLAADRSGPDGTDRQLFLQYIMSLGAHGAHSF